MFGQPGLDEEWRECSEASSRRVGRPDFMERDAEEEVGLSGVEGQGGTAEGTGHLKATVAKSHISSPVGSLMIFN